MTKLVLLRCLAIALFAGTVIAFVNSVLWMHAGFRYEPPMTPAEYQRLSGLTVANVEALLRTRQVRVTRMQALADSISSSFFWKNLAKNSLVPSLGVFLACLGIVFLERRYILNGREAGNSSSVGSGVSGADSPPKEALTERELKDRQDVMDALCAILAFLPWLVNAIYIHAGIAQDIGWQSFINPISLSALLWLFVTYFHYRRTRTRRAAWLFAFFPVAFAVPGLLVYLWFSVTHSK